MRAIALSGGAGLRPRPMALRATSNVRKTVLSVRNFVVGQTPRPAAEPQLGAELSGHFGVVFQECRGLPPGAEL